MSVAYNVMRALSRGVVAMSAGAALKAIEFSYDGKDYHEWAGLAFVMAVAAIISFYVELQFKVRGPNE